MILVPPENYTRIKNRVLSGFSRRAYKKYAKAPKVSVVLPSGPILHLA